MKSRKAKTITATMVVVCACGLLAYTLIATGGSLEPSAPPGPTMKTLDEIDPGTSIPLLPYIISTSGSYYLASDLTLTDTTVNGITVNADNVTIDLRGYSLIGPGSGSGYNYGIFMNNRSNVEIRNGTVRDFGRDGIYGVGVVGKGHRVIAVRAMSNGLVGIVLIGYAHLVKECTAVGNGLRGIAAGGYGSTVIGNTAYNNQGLGISIGHGSTVTGNTAYNNQGFGISTGSHCTVTGNTARVNQSAGIMVESGCTVTGNTACNNQEEGIKIWFADCLVDQNTAVHNNQSGGSYVNMTIRTDCTYGLNHAP